MPSRKPRAVKSTAPSPSPAASSRASSRTRAKKGVEEPVEEVAEPHETTGTEDEDPDEEDKGTQGPGEGGGDESVETDEQGADVAQEDPKGKGKMSMSERLAKMKDLRSRMVRIPAPALAPGWIAFGNHPRTNADRRTNPPWRTART
jgi:pre-mRNA-splicing factor SYF2